MTDCCQVAVTPPVPDRFIRLYENPRKEEEVKSKRWREEVVKDSREKEFLESYIRSLKDRGEPVTPAGSVFGELTCV